MMNIKLFFFSICLLLFKLNDGVAQAAYTLNVPAGWTTEKFELPPAFAPGLNLKGKEEAFFSPGWAAKKTEDYWTYCYLWTLNADVPLTKNNLEIYLSKYYAGLVKDNLTRNKIDTAYAIPVKVKLHGIKKGSNDKQVYEGQLSMLDYMTQDPIVLNLRIHIKDAKDENVVLFAASPLPHTHKTWTLLDGLVVVKQ